jgi:hypothetical protein
MIKTLKITKLIYFLQNLEGFYLKLSSYLNMGCYHIKLIRYASSLYTFVSTREKYENLRFTMGICNNTDISKEN